MSNALKEIEENGFLDAMAGSQFGMVDQLSAPAPVSCEVFRKIDALLNTLEHREFEVLQLFFGLDGREPMADEQVGSHLGLPSNQVARLREQALAKLRRQPRTALAEVPGKN
jgi:DNA-directed RNA polymerase specialized sigma subunit